MLLMVRKSFAPVTLNQLAAPLVVVAVAAALCISLGLFWAAQRADAQAIALQKALVKNNIEQQSRRLRARVNSELMWDDAVENIANQFDPNWINANIAEWFLETHDVGRVLIFDAQDQPIYFAENGTNALLSKASALGLETKELLAELRQRELQRGIIAKPSHFGNMLSKPIDAVAFKRLSLGPAFVVATLVQPDFGKSLPLQARAPIVFSIQPINSAAVREIAQVLRINDLQAESIENLAAGRIAVPLLDNQAQAVTWLSWQPERPGTALLKNAAPFLGCGFIAFLALVISMLRRTLRIGALLKTNEAQALHSIRTDALTGLSNRVLLNERMVDLIAQVRTPNLSNSGANSAAHPVALVLLDLDRFKDINDAFGHQLGDQMLIEIANRLRVLMPDNALLARLGGDEFAILLRGTDQEALHALARQLLANIALPININRRDHQISASIGIALLDSGCNSEELMRRADTALYVAKALGRSRTEFHDAQMDAASLLRRELASDLRHAISQSTLLLHYQPQFRCSDDMFIGVEALVRWDHAIHGWIEPSLLIAIAEESGLIQALGDWVIVQTLADGVRWPKLRLSINVSPAQFKAAEFADRIYRLCQQKQISNSRIELEITESLLLDPTPATTASLATLRAYGFKLVLDDFGTGYSSLGYLRRYRLDKLKIDRSFVQCADDDREGQALLSAIAAIDRRRC
jgi:diguanylate cyclase (GGDEF)-like protein